MSRLVIRPEINPEFGMTASVFLWTIDAGSRMNIICMIAVGTGSIDNGCRNALIDIMYVDSSTTNIIVTLPDVGNIITGWTGREG